jgi:hypothetical protein
MLIDAGPRDQRPIQALADYGLIYFGEALPADLTIAGEVRVTLSVQSTRPDTDFVAKLIDLHPDGSAMVLMGVTDVAEVDGEPLRAIRHKMVRLARGVAVHGADHTVPSAPAAGSRST